MIATSGVESSYHPLTVLNINSSDILKAVDHTKILVIIDIICGGCGVIMSGVCLYSWAQGQSSYRPFLGISLFVGFNLATSAISRLPWISKVTTESIRSVIGPLVAAAAFVLTIELFNGWLLGFMMMCMAGNALHTMLIQKPKQGRLLIGVYTAVLLGCVFLFIPDPNKYHVMLFVGAMVMTGLIFEELLAQYSNVLYQDHLQIEQQKKLVEQLTILVEQKRQQELEKELEVERVKSAFTNITDEFRTPIALIKGSAQNLIDAHNNRQKAMEDLNHIQKNSDILLKLINQRLDQGRLESTNIKGVKSTVDLNSFLNPVVPSSSSPAVQKKINGIAELATSSSVVNLHHEKVETIFVTPLGNARIREKVKIEFLNDSSNVAVVSAEGSFLANVKRIIQSELSNERLNVDFIAREVGLSRVQLYRKMLALTGTSVSELLRSLRLQKAAKLLEQKWGPVSQVAYAVGITNLSYFSKVFKAKFGITPSEYEGLQKNTNYFN
ncbi:MAG TPA: helix-turn-helix domain-containing protein [Chryseolinea sp.]|nr:helix-turn-helix domain-containing protein [Chryseolinea sp.]